MNDNKNILLGLVGILLLCCLCSAVAFGGYWLLNRQAPVYAPVGQPSGNPSGSNPTNSSSCSAISDGPVSFDVLSNMDVGDPGLVSVVYAWDKVNKSTAFVGVIDILKNLDFENPQIQGQYLHFTSLEAAACYAKEMAKSLDVTNMVFVSNGSAPDGFTTTLPVTGWKMSVTTYTDKPIEVTGANWTTLNVSKSDKHEFGDASWLYAQLWDGKNSKVVYHFRVEPGYTLKSPDYQGTLYKVSGGDIQTLLARFDQMTQEVIDRDDKPTVNVILCGASPKNIMSGWTCSKN